MIFTILAVFFFLASIFAATIGRKYTTSPPILDKLSVFASNDNDSLLLFDVDGEDSSNNKNANVSSASTSSKRSRYGPTLSIVIPCYNEEERLPIMLDQCLKFCDSTVKLCAQTASTTKSRQEGWFADYEIIVVDDCSKDGTISLFEKYQKEHSKTKFKLVKVNPNRGKGFAVRSGFLNASGDYVLMADGDGATEIKDVCKLIKTIRTHNIDVSSQNQNNNDNKSSSPKSPRTTSVHHAFIGVGSRAHLEEDSIAARTFFRTLLMHAFHFVVQVAYFCGTRGIICPIKDTQCGFKIFDRRLCEAMFLNARLERFAFDVELFIVANRLKLKAIEVPVNWKEVPGSKVNVKAMIQMGLDCLLLCFQYGFGFWEVQRR